MMRVETYHIFGSIVQPTSSRLVSRSDEFRREMESIIAHGAYLSEFNFYWVSCRVWSKSRRNLDPGHVDKPPGRSAILDTHPPPCTSPAAPSE